MGIIHIVPPEVPAESVLRGIHEVSKEVSIDVLQEVPKLISSDVLHKVPKEVSLEVFHEVPIKKAHQRYPVKSPQEVLLEVLLKSHSKCHYKYFVKVP